MSGVLALETPATPDNVDELLARLPGFPELRVLKIDIDSYDCALLTAAMRVVHPAAVILEINWAIPPPIKFARQYFEGWDELIADLAESGDFLATFGCSLQAAADLLPGYGLYGVQGGTSSCRDCAENVVFVREDLQTCMGELVAPIDVYASMLAVPLI